MLLGTIPVSKCYAPRGARKQRSHPSITNTNNTHAAEQPSTPGPEIKRLDVLVGTWRTQGQTVASPTDPSIEIDGTDSYEWLGGGFFLVHRVDVRMGKEKVEAIEIIGSYDASTQTYPMRSFDNQGNFVTMRASVSEDGIWTFAGESERATLTIGDDGDTMTAKWERSEDDGSNWWPWMDMKFTKAS
jgi:hypothetical protein